MLDPDKCNDSATLKKLLRWIETSKVDFIFVGGSLLTEGDTGNVIRQCKNECSVPVVLFPGHPSQMHPDADALLFLSLVSGRNAELLIGSQVVAAPFIKKHQIEAIGTAYMLIDCGKMTTAQYVSQSLPIPYNKPEIAAATALASSYLGMQCVYLDGGSGAEKPVSASMIREVGKTVDLPLIIGGGIVDETQAARAWEAGADIVVVGTAFEKEPELIFALNAKKNNINRIS